MVVPIWVIKRNLPCSFHTWSHRKSVSEDFVKTVLRNLDSVENQLFFQVNWYQLSELISMMYKINHLPTCSSLGSAKQHRGHLLPTSSNSPSCPCKTCFHYQHSNSQQLPSSTFPGSALGSHADTKTPSSFLLTSCAPICALARRGELRRRGPALWGSILNILVPWSRNSQYSTADFDANFKVQYRQGLGFTWQAVSNTRVYTVHHAQTLFAYTYSPAF